MPAASGSAVADSAEDTAAKVREGENLRGMAGDSGALPAASGSAVAYFAEAAGTAIAVKASAAVTAAKVR